MGGTHTNAAEPLIEPLTRREREVLMLLAEGLTSPEIAEKLTLATSSVKSHRQHLYAKLGVNSKRQALARARALGLLGVPATSAAPTTTEPSPRHNLPLQVTRFFGREAEKAAVGERLAEYRLVTLVGAGGVGKTRLSLQAAESALPGFDHGVWFVDLAALSDPELVAQQAAGSVSAPDEPGRPILDSLSRFLRSRKILLVLDNCEHLLEACARLTDSLLRACPGLKILATSREPLGVAGEATFVVPSLEVPEPTVANSVEVVSQSAAVRLFIDRVRLVQPDYRVTPHNVRALVDICRRLDGIPLAIEMAAARVKLLTADQLASRLEEAIQFLAGSSRTALPKHQTLRATIDWSYKLLSEAERLLLRRLSVFAGGCTLEAAEAVCSDEALPSGQMLEVLASLVAKSMVIADRRQGEPARYRMLEMVRQYAREKLEAAGERARHQELHADYFRRLAANTRPDLKGLGWPMPLRAEQENLRLALAASFSDQVEAEAGPRLLIQVLEHGLLSAQEVLAWSQRASAWLRTHPDISARGRIHIERLAANLLAATDLPAAVAALRTVVEDSRQLGPEHKSVLVWSLVDLSRWLASLNAVDEAWAALTEAEALFFTIDPQTLDPGEVQWTQAGFAGSKARLANKQGRYAEARNFSNEHLRLLRERGEPEGNFDVWLEMGHTSLDLKEYDAAHQQFSRARTFALELAARMPFPGLAYVNRCLGLVALGRGELDQAVQYSRENLKEAQQGPYYEFIPSSVGLAACVAARLGKPLRAATLSGAAEALYASVGRPAWEDSSLDTLLPGWRQGPDEAAIRQAYAAGQVLGMEEAIAYALNEAAA